MSPLRHIGLNAVFLRPPMGGVETYVRRLVPELVTAAPQTRFTLFVSGPGAQALRDEPWLSEVDVARHPLLGVPGLTALAEMTLLGRLARARGVEVLDSTAHTGPWRLRSAAHVVTIADLTWMAEPASVPAATRALWAAIVPGIARHADRILTFSEAARRDIVERLGIARSRVDVVPHGPGSLPAEDPPRGAELRSRLGLGGGPIVLAVGTNRANKNPERLIEAMERVVQHVPGTVLAMPGPPHPGEPDLRRLAARRNLADAVKFPGHVSSTELDGMYREAACVAVPSTHEGFGLVVLEAMRRGAPVACSSTSALPEVAGDAAEYFDPYDSADIARALVDVLTDRERAARLAERGRARAAGFTWRRAAEGTLECFERAWRERSGR